MFIKLFFILCGFSFNAFAEEEKSTEEVVKRKIEDLTSIPAGVKSTTPKYSKTKIASPPVPKKLKQKISISIGEMLPLKQAFLTLSEQTKVDLQLDPNIKTSLVFSAHQRPLIEIVHDLCELAGLRYRIIGENSIRIEQDTPYPVNYNAQFLTLMRSSNAQVSISTDVFSSMKEAQAGLDNGSNSVVNEKSEVDFWQEVQGNLETILTEEDGSSFTIHRQGGVISVRANSRQHKLIEQYLRNLKRSISSQVLIEAKIIEVNLKDEFRAGINWHKLTGSVFRANMPLGSIAKNGKHVDLTHANNPILAVGVQNNDFSAILMAIQQFGSCETLSSPRLTVLNNQNAILKVAQNQVYFRLKYDKDYNLSIDRESINISSDVQTVPIGFVMAVQPSIDHETGEIIMALRPTVSRLSRSVSDPAVDIAYSNAANKDSSITPTPSLIPVVEVREIDSVLRMASGEVAVLGGLMETRSNIENTKLPIAGDIPFLGKLFTAEAEVTEVVELVILLKATIVEDNTPLSIVDERLTKEYVKDSRPLV